MAAARVNTSKRVRARSAADNGGPGGPDGGSDSEQEGDTEDLKQKYKLQELELKTTLGTGTFGRVILARHKPTRQYFALKILTISEVIRLKQVEHVKSEKYILSQVQHPFIVNMLWSSHDEKYLYMLLEYVCGGELFSYLRNAGRFSVAAANFYACEIISALEYLHGSNIVYRDLKPENLLLDREGHLKLTDFGFAKKLDDRTWTLCGTPEYLAPEIIQSKGHNKAVDWWALGVLIYEMMVGYPPFFDDNPFGIYEKILNGKVEWPRHIDPVGKDLIRKLLVMDRTKRLGNMKSGTEDVRKHKWFRHINWDEVRQRKMKAPVIPFVSHRGDARNFIRYSGHVDLNDVLMDEEGVVMRDMLLKVSERPCDQNGNVHSNFNHHSNGQPPICPVVQGEGDTSNFDEYDEDGWRNALPVTGDDLAQFADF